MNHNFNVVSSIETFFKYSVQILVRIMLHVQQDLCVQTDAPFKIKIEFCSFDFHAQNDRCSAKKGSKHLGAYLEQLMLSVRLSISLSHLVGSLQPLKITLGGPNKTPVTIQTHTQVADSAICIGLAHNG